MLFSEPKIPQPELIRQYPALRESFSALQRAENSSTRHHRQRRAGNGRGFSALQRAENSSTVPGKIPDLGEFCVSVLFSEPKIPQLLGVVDVARVEDCFSALQRAENSSTAKNVAQEHLASECFSALQRAENSSTSRAVTLRR